jgi:hypothetical protein
VAVDVEEVDVLLVVERRFRSRLANLRLQHLER